jgi:hypothetical protein
MENAFEVKVPKIGLEKPVRKARLLLFKPCFPLCNLPSS